MTAAVPDPRFRDQLVYALRTAPDIPVLWPSSDKIVDALMPTIAAEVEARVQAAANQRAVEELRAAAEAITNSSAVRLTWWECAELLQGRADDLAAALTSPAPAPHPEEGQR